MSTTNPVWLPPVRLPSRRVIPDTTAAVPPSPGASSNSTLPYSDTSSRYAQAVDPGRMGVSICMLHDRPLLFPNVDTLNKHQAIKHPPPPMSTSDAAAAAASIVSSLAARNQSLPSDRKEGTAAETSSVGDVEMEIGSPSVKGHPTDAAGAPQGESGKPEYITWFFSPEEEARRRAFLPLK